MPSESTTDAPSMSSSAAFLVRAAGEEDLAVVAGIYAHYVRSSVATFEEVPPETADWGLRLRDLAERGLPFLVAEERASGEVVGYAYASAWRPRPAYRHTVEDTVYLAPGRSGKGLGRLLLGELVERASLAGARQMIGVIAQDPERPDATGAASIALHRAFGFAEAGRLVGVGCKHGRWLDTVLMQRPLTGMGGG